MLYSLRSFGAPIDPFQMRQPDYPGYYNLSGKVAVDPRIQSGELTKVIVTIGQSLITNHVSGSYTPGPKVHNLSLDSGGVYEAKQPLLGCSLTATPARESNYAMHLADKVIAAGLADRVILAPIGIGGTSVSQWANPLHCGERIPVLARRLAGQGYSADAILWHQGESDHGMPQADYTAYIQSVIGTFRANGMSCPFLVAQATYLYGVTSAAIRAAQAAVVDGQSVFAGPDIDTLGSSYRVDDLHLNQTGADAVADLWLAAIGAAGI